jgi:catechol 2,3-dioxygenase-like lactoylglutathione lyase family enzyme
VLVGVTPELIFASRTKEGLVGIRRVVPDITCDAIEESRDFYSGVLGFDVAMDMGWIVTLASPEVPSAQISLVSGKEEAAKPIPDITVEVDDVEGAHEAVVRSGREIVYPLTDEEWGVRRFFVRDPGGVVVNVMSHVDR